MRLRIGVLLSVIAVAVAAWYMTRPAPPPPRPMAATPVPPVGTITELAPHLYVVPGGGCNTTVFVTRSGVLLVDTKYPASWDDLLAQIRSVTDKPITHVINTHSHGDHSAGNGKLPAGTRVVVQAFTARAFREMPPPDGEVGPGTRLGTTPEVFDRDLTLFDGDDAIDLYYLGPAHTGGDAFVRFRSARVLVVGDVMPDKALPSIVLEGGGNGSSFAGVVARAAAIPDVDRIVTGHGGVLPQNELARYADLHQRLLDYVRANMHMGADKNAVFKAFHAPDRFEDFDLSRQFNTMDEIDRSLRPWWQRIW